MQLSKGVKIYSTILMVSGLYNLLGVGKYPQFALLFEGIAPILIKAMYVFTILYGICNIYCGMRMFKLEDWARKVVVGLASFSIVSGLFLNRIVMANFKEMLLSGTFPEVDAAMVMPIYNSTIIVTALVTLFEISVVYFFTRRDIKEQFNKY